MSTPTTTEDRPLHVRVAEALGWKCCSAGSWHPPDFEGHQPPVWPALRGICFQEDPQFDTDWEVTGPLIERYGIFPRPIWNDGKVDAWDAVSPWYVAIGPSPLIAVCNLILALHAAGKLEPRA